MPDPLLTTASFEQDYKLAQEAAKRRTSSLSKEGTVVFLRCSDMNNRPKLARIDCTGYPWKPPDVQFLDPAYPSETNVPISDNASHWPTNPRPLLRTAGHRLHMCIAGTKGFIELGHPDPGYVMDLPTLITTLVHCCRPPKIVAPQTLRR